MNPEAKSYYASDRRLAGESFVNGENERSKEKSTESRLAMAKVAVGNTLHNIGEKMLAPARYVKERLADWRRRRFGDEAPEEQVEGDSGLADLVNQSEPSAEESYDDYQQAKKDVAEALAEESAKSGEQIDDEAAEASARLDTEAATAKPEAAEANEDVAEMFAKESDNVAVDNTSHNIGENIKERLNDVIPLSRKERQDGMEQLRSAREVILSNVTSYNTTSAGQVLNAYDALLQGYARKGLDVDSLRLSDEDIQRMFDNAKLVDKRYQRPSAEPEVAAAAAVAPEAAEAVASEVAEAAPESATPEAAAVTSEAKAAEAAPAHEKEARQDAEEGNLDTIRHAVESGSVSEEQFNGMIDAYNRSLIVEATQGKNVANRMLNQAQVSGMLDQLRYNIKRNETRRQRDTFVQELRDKGKDEIRKEDNAYHKLYVQYDKMDSIFRNNTNKSGVMNKEDALAELKSAGVQLDASDLESFNADAAGFVKRTREAMDSLVRSQGAKNLDWGRVEPSLARWYLGGGYERMPHHENSMAAPKWDEAETPRETQPERPVRVSEADKQVEEVKVAEANHEPKHARHEQEDDADHEAQYEALDKKIERDREIFGDALDNIDELENDANDWRYKQGVENNNAVSDADLKQKFGDLYDLLEIKTDANGNQLPIKLSRDGKVMAFEMAAAMYDQKHQQLPTIDGKKTELLPTLDGATGTKDALETAAHAKAIELTPKLDAFKEYIKAFNQFNAARRAKNEKPVSFYSFLIVGK